jgi:hypothetical protein
MKKIRRHEPIGIIIHIYMEMSQGNSLCRYLKQAKKSFLFVFSFFFYKIGEQEGGTGPVDGGWRYHWEGKCWGKGVEGGV